MASVQCHISWAGTDTEWYRHQRLRLPWTQKCIFRSPPGKFEYNLNEDRPTYSVSGKLVARWCFCTYFQTLSSRWAVAVSFCILCDWEQLLIGGESSTCWSSWVSSCNQWLQHSVLHSVKCTNGRSLTVSLHYSLRPTCHIALPSVGCNLQFTVLTLTVQWPWSILKSGSGFGTFRVLIFMTWSRTWTQYQLDLYS